MKLFSYLYPIDDCHVLEKKLITKNGVNNEKTKSTNMHQSIEKT